MPVDVADDDIESAASRGEKADSRFHVASRSTASGQDPHVPQLWERFRQGTGCDGAARWSRHWPALSVDVLDAEQDVETTTEWVAVDQQDAVPAAAGFDRDRRGVARGAGAADSPDHRHDTGFAATVDGRRQRRQRPPAIGRVQHFLGTEGNRVVPGLRPTRPWHDENAGTSRREVTRDLLREIVAHEYELRTTPRPPRHPGVTYDIRNDADSRTPVEEYVEERIVGRAEQWC